MQQKLCLWLCLLVLLGALCAGNPFLSCRDGVTAPLAAPASPRERDLPRDARQPAPAPRAPASRAAFDGGLGKVLGVATGAPMAAGRPQPVNAVVPVALAANVPADAASSCPDAAVAPLVEAVERGERGEVVWVLRDGRRLVRNPRRGEGLPLLVSQ